MNAYLRTLTGSLIAAVVAVHAHAAAPDYARAQDSSDREAVTTSPASYLCEFGRHTDAWGSAALACSAAHLEALEAGRYDDALRLATIGCEKRGAAVSCRQAARVPLYMGNAGTPVPVGYVRKIREIALHVCQSGAQIWHPFAGKVTGRECAALAHHFVLAVDDDYRFALRAAAREHFERAYEPRLAETLYRHACKRWRSRDACEQLGATAALVRAERESTKLPIVQIRSGFETWNTGEARDVVVCRADTAEAEHVCRSGVCRPASPEAAACMAQAQAWRGAPTVHVETTTGLVAQGTVVRDRSE